VEVEAVVNTEISRHDAALSCWSHTAFLSSMIPQECGSGKDATINKAGNDAASRPEKTTINKVGNDAASRPEKTTIN
jgi:hypothetical protein